MSLGSFYSCTFPLVFLSVKRFRYSYFKKNKVLLLCQRLSIRTSIPSCYKTLFQMWFSCSDLLLLLHHLWPTFRTHWRSLDHSCSSCSCKGHRALISPKIISVDEMMIILFEIPCDKHRCSCQSCEGKFCPYIGPRPIATCQDDHQYLAMNLLLKKLGWSMLEGHHYWMSSLYPERGEHGL